MKKIIYISFLCCLLTNAAAQDTAFWFVAPHMSEFTAGSPATALNYPAFLAISNSTYQTANVVITLYNGGSTLTIPATIPPGGLYKHDFSTPTTIKQIENPRGQAGSVVKYGTHISSTVPVTAYYMLNHTESRDIFTLKGHQALGTLFYIPMQSDNAAKSGGTFGGYDQVDIVATEDNTTVEVTPKARIRLGASTLSPANTVITRTMQKGETLKIIEYGYDENPSLAGSRITATRPVAVTVTEDLVNGDTSGDQIVPVPSLGTRYIVPRGYLTNTSMERFYLIGASSGTTTVRIYASGTNPTVTTTLTAGQAYRYTFPAGVNAIYVDATDPIYLYQRSGYGEEGAALLPSVYAIGQTQLAFYQVGNLAPVQKGFLLFRTGAQGSFTISYGSTVNAPMTLTPLDVPNVSEWKIARFDLPSAPTAGQVITVRSSQSPFSFGYITGAVSNNDSYGYFSAFGTFEFSDTTYMCGSSVTIEGGYATSHLWTFPDGVTTSTATSIVATEEGTYTLVMNQDPNIVTATTYVKKVNAGSITLPSQTICEGNTPQQLNVTGASDLPGTAYQWQISTDNQTWTNIQGATSSAYSPGSLTRTTYYRRGMTSDYCEMAFTYATEVRVSTCAAPVNPHLRARTH
ncbi:MAG: IgGFc-binding protein [Tannerellaceae bacterium]|jgi:hypothetical protein|nr:IgGFc-binding protein [Tannerellaceae bacterium]